MLELFDDDRLEETLAIPGFAGYRRLCAVCIFSLPIDTKFPMLNWPPRRWCSLLKRSFCVNGQQINRPWNRDAEAAQRIESAQP